MKIVFVCSEDKWLGVGYLSSYLKSGGHQTCLLFDPMFFNKAYIKNERLRRFFRKDSEFVQRIKEIKPDLIGFSVVVANYQWALEMAAVFKQNFDIPIIFGGPHVTIVPDEVISHRQVDMIAIGESEQSLLELVDSGFTRKDIKGIWFKDGPTVIKNALRELETDIDRYPFPDEELFFEQLPASYRITPSVITSRGCPFNCTYCGNQIMQKIYRDAGSGTWVRRRSVENVLSELSWRKEKHRSRHFVFMDDIFTSDLEWLREFIKKYKERINLPFNCLAHPGLACEETMALLKEGGCILVDFGLQSGCADIRQKVLYRYENNGQVLKIAQACKKYGLRFALDCILNLPFDTEETVKESLAVFNAARPDMVNCFPLAYLPRTRIVDIARDAGILNDADIDLINQGKRTLYFSLSVDRRRAQDDYSRYSFLFVALPIIPRCALTKIINKRRLFGLFTRMPRVFLILARTIVQFKSGFWFIFSNVLNNELFYLRGIYSRKAYLKKR